MIGKLGPSAKPSQWQDRVVLVLSPTPTHPQDYGNRKRIFRVCRMLQEAGAKIHFVHYASEAEWRQRVPMAAQTQMMEQWDGYYLVPPTRDLHTDPGGTHHSIDEWWDPALENVLQWLGDKLRPDAFFVNYTWLSKALEFAPRQALKVLDTHDKFSGRKELFLEQDLSPEFFYTTEEQERIALDRADVVWAIKEEERHLFGRMTKTPVVTVPHADPSTYLPKRPAPEDDRDFELRIGIMGARNTINTRNLSKFLEAARPVFRQHLPPLKIVIGGTVCELLAEDELPFVEKLGWVEDVREFYEQIDVSLVPMEFSTGLKIKTSEAMTFGIPLISHVHAFEGYEPYHAYHEMKSFEDIAEACADLAFEGASALDELRRATARSHKAVVQAMEDGIEQTGSFLKASESFTLMCLRPGSLQPGSLSLGLVKSNIEYMALRGSVVLHCQDIVDPGEFVRFSLGLNQSQIFVNPAAKRHLSKTDIETLESAGVRWSRLEQVFNRFQVNHLWLDDVPAVAPNWQTSELERIYLNLNVMTEPDVEKILNGGTDPFTGPFTMVTALSCKDSEASSMIRHQLGAEHLKVLPFWPKSFPLLWSFEPPQISTRYGTNVILSTESPAIMRLIEAVAQNTQHRLINLIVLDDTAETTRREYLRGLQVCRIPPSAIDKAAIDRLKRARTTVNLAGSALFAQTLTSILEAAGHDVLKVDNAKASSLLTFIQTLTSRLVAPEPAKKMANILPVLSNFDPGRGIIWQHNQ